MISIKSDKIILGESLFDGYIYLDDGKILEVTKQNRPCDEPYDFTGSFVSAGFIELHSHGGNGYSFVDCAKEDVINGCNFHLTKGVTSMVPTITASPFSTMRDAVVEIDKAKRDSRLLGNIIGAHLEGPYLSREQCGAQYPDFLTSPIKEDYQKLVEDYGNSIARWTYAPENDADGEFCKFLTDHGIIASAGHTNAIQTDMKIAIDNGCNLITHLFSCTSTITRDKGFRRLGVIETAFLEDDLFVEIIADGKHLPSDLIKLILKIKGIDKVCLITDSLSITGTDIKQGEMSKTKFIIEDGVCKLLDRSAFAGSIATADRLIRVMTNDVGLEVTKAVKMMTEVPAKLLKVNKGRIEKGYDADIIVFDENIQVSNVFVGGKKKI